jgi:adenylate kinase
MRNTLAPAIILFGSPGSGKGTQAKLLHRCLNAPHISTGDMLRSHITAGDEVGRQSQQLLRAGRLVSDELVNELVRERMLEADCRSGILLDGYPRTLNQARALLKLTAEDGFRPIVVHLGVDYAKTVARLSGRRQCPVCGTLYSLKTNPPKVAGVCDLDGAALITREDDRETVIQERLREYDSLTLPILNFFREAGVPTIQVDAGESSPEEIRQRICQGLSELGVAGAIEAVSPGSVAR